MRIGPFEFNLNFRDKSYKQLVQMFEREKKSSAEDPKTNPKRQLAEYRSWQYSAISLISDRVSTVPYKFYRKDTDIEVTSTNHAYKIFTKPFFKPNPLMSFRFIKAWCQVQLDMCGMACVYKARNALGQIWELWPLNMNDFFGCFDKKGMPIEFITDVLPSDVIYVFQIGGKQYSFSNFELVILSYPHPTRPYLGASPIQAQAYSIDTQRYIEIYERDFFANSARVDMVLKTEQEVNDDKADEIKARWNSKFSYGSGGKFHDITVLSSGLEPVPLKYTNKDFEFMHLAGWTKDQVLSAYRINPAKLGNTTGVNRSSGVQVDIDFNRDCIQPRIMQWDEELNKEILSEFDSRVEIRHDNPIPRDRLIEMQEGRVFLAGNPSLTPDEFRHMKFNLPAIDGGDELIVSSTMIPVSLLKPMWKARIKQMNTPKPNNQSQTDPTRHDGDQPHLRPDGGDNRDELPTEGRSLESFLREYWVNSFEDNLELFGTEENVSLFFKSSIKTMLEVIYNKSGIVLEDDDWADTYSKKISKEFYKTLFSGSSKVIDRDYIRNQINTNSRLAKICNSTLRSCINYVRFKYLEKFGLDKVWLINSNICGHRGRLLEFVVKDNFKIGDSEIRFPGETFNLNCDCMIGIPNGIKQII
jgi:HK97 family phage portal protein